MADPSSTAAAATATAPATTALLPPVQPITTTAATKTSSKNKDKDAASTFGWTDDQFQDWLTNELQKDPLHSQYPDIFQAAPKCITKWRQRYRGDRATWRRIFEKDRVMKEFIEAVPIIDVVQRLVNGNNNNNNNNDNDNDSTNKKYTIVDLASGKGYLSMLLSELLPPSKVEKFVLIDKAWPQHDLPPQPHHISWTHIYGFPVEEETNKESHKTDGTGDKKHDDDNKNDDDDTPQKSPIRYYDTWPIPLTTSKQDLKHKNQRRNLTERFLSEETNGPVIMLAVHLCGTLSLKAVQFFNDNPNICFFCLKPCCLPGMIHAKRHEVFSLGNENNEYNNSSSSSSSAAAGQRPYCRPVHKFDAKLVCMAGKWKKNKWHGPPRTELRSYFKRWADNLYLGIDDYDAKKIQKTVLVQTDGGYQNEFLFAERLPGTPAVWEALGEGVTGTAEIGRRRSSSEDDKEEEQQKSEKMNVDDEGDVAAK